MLFIAFYIGLVDLSVFSVLSAHVSVLCVCVLIFAVIISFLFSLGLMT